MAVWFWMGTCCGDEHGNYIAPNGKGYEAMSHESPETLPKCDGCSIHTPTPPHALTREQEVARALQRLREDPFRLGAVEIMGMIYDEWTNLSRITLSQQAQELAYWKQQAAHFTKRCAEQGDSIAEDRRLLDQQAQEVERMKLELKLGLTLNHSLRDALATMTAERDNYLSKWRASADLNKGLLRDYDASQARVEAFQAGQEEIASVLGWANVHPYTKQTFILNQIAHLQATLAEREQVIQQQEATLKGYRHSFKIVGQQHDDRKDERDAIEKRYAVLEEDFTLACQQRDTARQDTARLREALQFYATPATYFEKNGMAICKDMGQRAQQALKGA